MWGVSNETCRITAFMSKKMLKNWSKYFIIVNFRVKFWQMNFRPKWGCDPGDENSFVKTWIQIVRKCWPSIETIFSIGFNARNEKMVEFSHFKSVYFWLKYQFSTKLLVREAFSRPGNPCNWFWHRKTAIHHITFFVG